MQASDAGDEASTRRIFIFFFVYTVGFRNAFAFLPGHAGQADGAIGSVPLDSMAEIKENLKQFTEATHCKASQVLTWIQNVEVSATDRSNKQLDSFSF